MATQPKKPTTRAVNGEILDYGSANYQDNPENNMSYFVDIKQDNGQVFKLWGVKLEEVMENNGFKKGDKVNLIDHGLQNNVRQWEGQYYEELKEINSIEKDDEGIVLGKNVPRQLSTNADLNNSDNKERKEYQSVNHKVDDEEITDEQEYFAKLPPSVKHNYEAIKVNKFLKTEKVNYYDKTNPSSIAFEDRNTSLNTANSDEKTVNAMLDMAQAKGWKSIKLKGTEEFKRQMWLEAQLRGIETKGYKPKEEDLVAFKVKQAERTKNEIEQDMASEKDMVINIPEPDKEQAPAEPTAEAQEQGRETERELNTELDTGNEQTPPVPDNQEQTLDNQEQESLSQEQEQDMTAPTAEETDKAVHDELVNESLAMRERYYQTGWKREQDVLSENYHEIGDGDFVLKNLNATLTEYKKPHYALDSNSDVHFIKGTIESLDIPSETKKEVIDNFNNRMTKEFYASDSHDMPHENRLLRNTAIMGRYDLQQALNELDAPNKDEVLKAYDSKVIDYSQKASEHQRYFKNEKQLESIKQSEAYAAKIPNDAKDFANKEKEKEAYIRSEEFNNGRDLGDDDVTLKADIERFGDNLAVPTGKTETQEAARQRVEAAFERKVDKTDQRQHQREQLVGKDAVAVAGYKKMIAEKLKDNPELMVAKLNDVDKAIASQKEFRAPEMPSNKIESSVEIQKTQPSNQDRSR